MTIRPSTEQDIPSIVALLKLSLGESLMPKTEAFWKWKHVDNPFGKSFVFLAFEGEILIGVRAFMRWEWRQKNEVYKSVRAVDTATHPQYQGKGVFRQLTLQLVEHCKVEGVMFIFNTPNKKSLPGYLSMGWENLGRMKIQVRPLINFKYAQSKSIGPVTESFLKSFALKINRNMSDAIVSNSSLDFFLWRYLRNPNIQYNTFESEACAGIFRVKPGPLGSEFRLCELVVTGSQSLAGGTITQAAREAKSRIISFAGSKFPSYAFRLPIGPSITIRKLSSDDLQFSKLSPSLGDMEVF